MPYAEPPARDRAPACASTAGDTPLPSGSPAQPRGRASRHAVLFRYSPPVERGPDSAPSGPVRARRKRGSPWRVRRTLARPPAILCVARSARPSPLWPRVSGCRGASPARRRHARAGRGGPRTSCWSPSTPCAPTTWAATATAPAETPALDRLAREGVRFAHASSPVPLTLPSHTTILSGLLPLHHGLRNNGAGAPAAPAPRPSPPRLAAAGYRTGAFVGAFVLDHRFGLKPRLRGLRRRDRRATPTPASRWRRRAAAARGGGPRARLARPRRTTARPFFLWVHLYDAHAPYTPPSP